jgi:hypothetical protein
LDDARSERLRHESLLRRLGRLYSIGGGTRATEERFAATLRLASELGDARSLVVTLVRRGQHRLQTAADPSGGADWGAALALALSVERPLTQRVVAATAWWARDRCLSGRADGLLSAALAALVESAGATADQLTLGEAERADLALVLNAFRVIGAVCACRDGSGGHEDVRYAATARTGAVEVDRFTAGAFALTELVARRLP